ncbi:NADAR family protein [Mucilaginibacter sp. KACC 22773]|uniref:NADAR family protein n=1 Tax=Mucilaginibacter sp. KACC 22773 TaxID=3025671 RepID=UPI002365F243|nr:NADAR family protein [Mucilaginibacter sp. KACC 22773]WDF75951.1 NADAR family protein [Mucilaginibacter sp. KACC 22773]
MEQHYSLQWLTDKFENGDNIKYLFFWGHRSKRAEIDKSCFSQWFELPFVVDGITYKTAEHWMMANKAMLFGNPKISEKIIAANSPGEVKELGRQVLGFDEIIWAQKRFEIVVTGNIHKFNQHPEFAEYLINTGDRVLVEASPADTIWGIGLAQDNEDANNIYCWRGPNLLGFALMEVRDFLKGFGHFEAFAPLAPPPWKVFPGVESMGMFWGMGKGEQVAMEYAQYYWSLSDRDKTILKLTSPSPYDWNYYD